MNAQHPIPQPVLVKPAWQQLCLTPVRGQKLRHRSPRSYPTMTAKLAEEVSVRLRIEGAR